MFGIKMNKKQVLFADISITEQANKLSSRIMGARNVLFISPSPSKSVSHLVEHLTSLGILVTIKDNCDYYQVSEILTMIEKGSEIRQHGDVPIITMLQSLQCSEYDCIVVPMSALGLLLAMKATDMAVPNLDRDAAVLEYNCSAQKIVKLLSENTKNLWEKVHNSDLGSDPIERTKELFKDFIK